MRLDVPANQAARSQRGFTMIEIAIAVGVIGFALVAIIGILPRGMSAEKENREDAIISQDAPYIMNAIRNGEMRTNYNVLANYVESIVVTNINGTTTNITTSLNTFLTSGSYNGLTLTNDSNIVGVLSTPSLDPYKLGSQTNYVSAIIRGMNGSAVQQNGANSNTAFRYQLSVEIDSWNYVPPTYNAHFLPYSNTVSLPGDSPGTAAQLNYLASSLHEIRLRFAWPIYPNGSIGQGRQTYRSLINSHLTNMYGMWFFLPQTYYNNPIY